MYTCAHGSAGRGAVGKGGECTILGGGDLRPAELDIVGQPELVAVHIDAHGLMHRRDLHGIVQRQIAVVLHLQIGDLGVARLPHGIFVKQILGVFRGEPCLFAILANTPILQTHVQLAGHDLVDAGRGRIGEPRKGGTDQHRHTQHQREHAGQQGAFGSFLAHSLFLLFRFFAVDESRENRILLCEAKK